MATETEKHAPVAEKEEKPAESAPASSEAVKAEEEKPADVAPAPEAPAVVSEEKKADLDAAAEIKEMEIKSDSAVKTAEKSEGESPESEEKPKEENGGKPADEENTKTEDAKEEEAKTDAEPKKEDEKAEDSTQAMDVEPTTETKEEETSPSKRGRPKGSKNYEEKTQSTPSIPEGVRRSGRERRERKSTDFLTPVEKEEKVLVIPKGKGTKLGDIPNIVANFKEITWSDPHLHSLHTVVFGRGKKKEFKSHLLEFSGLVYPEGCDVEDEQDKVKAKMYKLKMDELKGVMDLCDVDRSKGDKGDLCDRFLVWLEEPKESGKKKAAAGKKSPAKKSPGKRKESPAPKKTKTPPTKKAKTETPKKSSAKKSPKVAKKAAKGDEAIDFNIPGTTIDKVREKVKTIVENANRQELTVKGVRKLLEEWLDTDLSSHKDAIRSLVMEVM